jgi:hypothetical protein
MLFTSAMRTHAEKNRGRRVLFPLKRANIAAFCLYDRAAGSLIGLWVARWIRWGVRATCSWVPPPTLVPLFRTAAFGRGLLFLWGRAL